MAQEEKDLLLKDISARLPYEIKFPYHIEEDSNHRECDCIATVDSIDEYGVEFTYYENGKPRDWSCHIVEVKPYLRSISSITKNEINELETICGGIFGDGTIFLSEDDYEFLTFSDVIDFLNEHHFDYRHLIEKGLALEAPENMYNSN